MSAHELLDRSVCEIADLVGRGEVSAVAMARASLERIEARNPKLGAFVGIAAEQALSQAEEIDTRRSRGEALGKLAGVPIGLKDALCARGMQTTCASKILERDGRGWEPPFDATVVSRLREAGAILVGKCNMDEFAMGSSNETSVFGPARNPWDEARTAGGSSGGSASAVAGGMAPATLGSDTGGSIRQPAAHSGLVGVKPTYGRVSRYGLVAFASSLDQIGPLTRDVRGAARILEVIAGRSSDDSTTVEAPVGEYEAACEKPVRGLRIGVPEEYFAAGLDPEIAAAVRASIERLREAGCTVHPIKLPHTDYAVATYYVLATAEASSNLSRFDGVRFGLRVEPKGGDLDTMYGATRDEGFGLEVKRRIMLGTFVLSAGLYDAYYVKAQKVRTLIRRDFEEAFREVDIIAAPTTPTPAFRLGERIDDPLAMYLADIYTLPASLAGLPAISLPCALARATSERPELPIGLQLIAPPLEEARLFTVAAACEATSPVRNRRAPSY